MPIEATPPLSKAQLHAAKGSYEALGIEFIGDNAILKIPGKASIIVESSALFDPSAEKLKELTKSINALLGNDIEMFDPADLKYSYKVGELRIREIGRIFSHVEIQGSILNPKLVNYYTYLRVEAESDVPDNEWEQIALYVACVIAVIGLLVLITLIPGGKILITDFVAIVAILTSGCLVIVAGVSNTSKTSSYVNSYVGT